MSRFNLFIPEKRKSIGRRNDKIAARIKECFALELTKGNFPTLPGHESESKLPSPVTITFVDLSPDLRNAVVYFMPLGGLCQKECIRFFELQTHHFKNAIAKHMHLRFIPNISFRLDNSFEYSAKIDNLLNNA